MTEGFHYTACGLDYVFLRNGYAIRDTKYGPAVAIQDVDALHSAIARTIISSPDQIRGQEVRFLRSVLSLSQEGLGRVLQESRPTVARWEGEPEKGIPGASDSALRLFCAAKLDGNALALEVATLLEEIDELQHQIAVLQEKESVLFEEADGHWQQARAA